MKRTIPDNSIGDCHIADRCSINKSISSVFAFPAWCSCGNSEWFLSTVKYIQTYIESFVPTQDIVFVGIAMTFLDDLKLFLTQLLIKVG